MSAPAPGSATVPASGPDAEWMRLDDCLERAPPPLHAWLAEPGLLTARVRRACRDTRFRLLRLERAPLASNLALRMAVADVSCLLREIEFSCGEQRWIFAQSVFPESSVQRHPWLAALGDRALGESLLDRHDVSREPLEYRELATADELAIAAGGGRGGPVWARRAVYQVSDAPILVQEVFLPALIQEGREMSRPGSTT